MPRITPFTDFELDSVERSGATSQQAEANAAGRHSTTPPPTSSTGGRRRRADDSDNDVLAQILAREKPSPQQ